MNDMPASLVNILTYSDIEHTLLGSRQHFRVDVCFRKEGQLLIRNLYVF